MNKEKDSIATIIPFYNGSEYLPDALNSLKDEQHVSNEIIIVNDGSINEEAEKLDNIVKDTDKATSASIK